MPRRFARRGVRCRAGVLALSAVLATGCSGLPGRGVQPQAGLPAPAAAPAAGGGAGKPSSEPAADPAAVYADELGEVPVLMYHQLKARPAGVYDRTPADFRAELERLVRERYVPVTASAYARGDLDVPAGSSPVVLTFDDSTRSQLTLGPDGEPLPDTSVGILLDVARRNPGFRPVATFFVNDDPFAEPRGTSTLRWLHDHGFEVANHTLGHVMLRGLSAGQVQRQLAGDVAMIRRAVPDAAVDTVALPFGVFPANRHLAMRGSADGVSYEHRAIFLVGYKPAPSPYASAYDPEGVPRIRSQGSTGKEARFASTGWLDELARKPALRYVSDGNPGRISFPKASADRLDPAYADTANPY